MSVEENKTLVKHFIEAGNNVRGDAKKIKPFMEEFLALSHVHHSPTGDTKLEETTKFYNMVFTAFPDLNYSIDDVVAEGDKVVLRLTSSATHKGAFQGIPATGKKIRFKGVDIFRVAGSKITDEWSFPDVLGLMQQLGAIPSGPPKK
jgi:steroid delta-isomerase-like uncharacterized protein